jgi:hypothetical protein
MEFVNEPMGGVDGYKINHLEQGLPGWKIAAINAGTGEVFTTTTDASGYFAIILPLGTWTLAETVPNGWKAVTASQFTINVSKPFVFEHVRFKNRATSACVDVFKRDAYDQSGLPGWTISLKPKYGGKTTQAVTDGTGWVRFSGLTPGWYTVDEQVLDGWEPNGPTQVDLDAKAYGISCVTHTFWNHQLNASGATAPAVTMTPVQSTPAPAAGACRIWYYVQPGDTLERIAAAYGCSMEALKAANNLTSNTLTPGQKLCIP